jgi:crotonobetainyl-CoA:carnitine CoA-transferase CaiB-like acyl-CoA transferase
VPFVDLPTSLPLDGLLVVAVEQAVAVPLATRHLADLGARVVKVERPDGGDFARHYDHHVGGVSAYFAWLNRGKESVTADLKDDAGIDLCRRLISRADIFVQNLAPGAAARMGIDAPTLARADPRLIACDVSGYGSTGPYKERKAYDLLMQAETGFLSITGTPAERVKAGISIADISAGMYTFSSILAALYERERTDRGTALEVALFDTLAEWMGQPMYQARYAGAAPRRSGAHHASIAPYGPFATADGGVVIGLQNEREWRSFCREVMREPELARDQRFASNAKRVERTTELRERIQALFSTLDTAEVESRLEAGGIAYSVDRDPAELWEHPQVRERERVRTIGAPTGAIEALLPPFGFDGREPRMAAVPAAGQHTRQIEEWLAAEEGAG